MLGLTRVGRTLAGRAGLRHPNVAADEGDESFHACRSMAGGKRVSGPDVYWGYRLLLGREPDEEGWRHYRDAIRSGGLSREELVSDLLTSPECRHRGLLQPSHERGHELRSFRGFRLWVARGEGMEEEDTTTNLCQFLDRHLREGDTFLDIGADRGYLTMRTAMCVGSMGRVVAIEPDRYRCALILASAAANGFRNIDLYPFAAGAQTGLTVGGAAGVEGAYAAFDGDLDAALEQGLVHSVRLDEALCDRERLDVLKVDIGEAGYWAIAGARDLLRRTRPLIVAGLSPGALHQTEVRVEDFLGLLEHLGYQLGIIGADGRALPCVSRAEVMERFWAQGGELRLDIAAEAVTGDEVEAEVESALDAGVDAQVEAEAEEEPEPVADR
jgi:FkbM family methyltransferase